MITVLVENTSTRPDLATEHGLSFCIDWAGQKILMDTGQGITLKANAETLGLPLAKVDTVILSHGHWDHTGGLVPLFDAGARPTVHMHPDAFVARWSKWHKPPEEPISLPRAVAEALRTKTRELIWTTKPTQVAEGLWVTGPVPRKTDFEDVGGPFYLDAAFTRPDPIADDQAIWFETKDGLTVLLGCAHAGVVNTLDYIAECSGGKRIRTVIGGMHLLRAKTPRLEATVAALKRHGVERIGAAHCTGERAVAYLAEHLPGTCVTCTAGTKVEIDSRS
jgi:7,8-dihydropterin-6-yl-methyl-4-(beta-D-ribofuranosyl)aminobenzene 5'-phosphate synthase